MRTRSNLRPRRTTVTRHYAPTRRSSLTTMKRPIPCLSSRSKPPNKRRASSKTKAPVSSSRLMMPKPDDHATSAERANCSPSSKTLMERSSPQLNMSIPPIQPSKKWSSARASTKSLNISSPSPSIISLQSHPNKENPA